jgi:YHS domain-containing protein
MKNKILIGLAVVVVLIGTFATVKKVSPVSWGMWGTYNASSDVALHGYDPVAYFKNGEATEGSSDNSYEWSGASWHFSSKENQTLFEQNPTAYAPQFGGFCSFAVSKGFTADISPDAWHIQDNSLYVFADQNVRDEWVAGLDEGSLESSEANWAKR